MGFKWRQFNPGIGLREIQYTTLAHAKAFDDLLGQQDSISISDFAKLSLHKGIITLVIMPARPFHLGGIRAPPRRFSPDGHLHKQTFMETQVQERTTVERQMFTARFRRAIIIYTKTD